VTVSAKKFFVRKKKAHRRRVRSEIKSLTQPNPMNAKKIAGAIVLGTLLMATGSVYAQTSQSTYDPGQTNIGLTGNGTTVQGNGGTGTMGTSTTPGVPSTGTGTGTTSGTGTTGTGTTGTTPGVPSTGAGDVATAVTLLTLSALGAGAGVLYLRRKAVLA